MDKQFPCWQCGNVLKIAMPFSRREVCDACNADQHVCRLCRHYDPALTNQCREDRADTVTEKERANFCDYFNPNPNAYTGGDRDPQQEAKAKLDALFGDSASEENNNNAQVDKNAAARKALEDLFNPPDSTT